MSCKRTSAFHTCCRKFRLGKEISPLMKSLIFAITYFFVFQIFYLNTNNCAYYIQVIWDWYKKKSVKNDAKHVMNKIQQNFLTILLWGALFSVKGYSSSFVWGGVFIFAIIMLSGCLSYILIKRNRI